jgi:uncharacterized membrane protein YdjX (TVP38/TMEM64 family)
MDPMPAATESAPTRGLPWTKLAIAIAVLAAAGIALWQFGPAIQAWFSQALAWIQGLGPWGPIIFIVLYILNTVLFLPGSILTLGAGIIFGVFSGAFYVVIGATIGANLAFLIGRYLARDRVARLIEGNRKFAAIDRAIAQEGWKIVGLIRLSPAFPFNVLNYMLGLTRVSFTDNIIGTFGIVPGTFMYVYIGSLFGSLATVMSEEAQTLSTEQQTAQWIVRIVGLIATVAVTVYVTKIARKALNEVVEEKMPEAQPSPPMISSEQ